MRNRLCVGGIAWRPTDRGVLYTVSRGIDENRLGLETRALLPALTEPARDLLDAFDRPSIQWIAWRAPTWIYLAYVVVGLTAWRRRMPSLALPLLPLACLQLSVVALNPAQDARYMLPAELLAILVLPLGTVGRSPGSAHRRFRGDDPQAKNVGEAVE